VPCGKQLLREMASQKTCPAGNDNPQRNPFLVAARLLRRVAAENECRVSIIRKISRDDSAPRQQPRQGRHKVAQGVSPGWDGPHPAFTTPLPPERERGRG